MFSVPNTVASVARTLAEGLENGTVVLHEPVVRGEGSRGVAGDRPPLAFGETRGVGARWVYSWVLALLEGCIAVAAVLASTYYPSDGVWAMQLIGLMLALIVGARLTLEASGRPDRRPKDLAHSSGGEHGSSVPRDTSDRR